MNGVLSCNEVLDIGFGDVDGNDVVLGDGGDAREVYTIVLVASDPGPFD